MLHSPGIPDYFGISVTDDYDELGRDYPNYKSGHPLKNRGTKN
jgi:hypothetical protein